MTNSIMPTKPKLTKLEKFVYNNVGRYDFDELATQLNRTRQAITAAFNRALVKMA